MAANQLDLPHRQRPRWERANVLLQAIADGGRQVAEGKGRGARVADPAERDVRVERHSFDREGKSAQGLTEITVERFETMDWSVQTEPEDAGPAQIREDAETGGAEGESGVAGNNRRQREPDQRRSLRLRLAEKVEG